jgi:hypothetical protein
MKVSELAHGQVNLNLLEQCLFISEKLSQINKLLVQCSWGEVQIWGAQL